MTMRTKCGFSADGRRYFLRDPELVERGDSMLWNDRMQVLVDHRGNCDATYWQPNNSAYAQNLRAIFVRDDDSGKCFSAPSEPMRAKPQRFEFSPSQADLRWLVHRDGLEVVLRLVVPRRDPVELWTAEVRNLSAFKRRVSLVSCVPFIGIKNLSQFADFDPELGGIERSFFPYYVKVDDYEKLRAGWNRAYCLADVKPDAYECSPKAFFGKNPQQPAALEKHQLGNNGTHAETPLAAMQFARHLAPGASFTVNIAIGPARTRAQIRSIRRRYLAAGGVDRALAEVQAFLAARTPCAEFRTPDSDLNHYVNHWLPHRTLFMGRTMRGQLGPCGRNAIQDAMGGVFTDPTEMRQWFIRICEQQEQSGWMPHGFIMASGVSLKPINTIPHRDIGVWLPMALHVYLAETGDFSLLKEKAQFNDGTGTATVYDHACLTLEWLLRDRTARGLSRIGEGDWNDPLNMAGHLGRGESVWLTQALIFALELWAGVAERTGDTTRSSRYRREATHSRDAVNRHAWDGQWYIRGTTDAGRPFGSRRNREGRIFLNSQSWALISGAAKGERLEACLHSVARHLSSPSGPAKLAPAYTAWDPTIGKLTLKHAGHNENGAVYCHAAVFYAYGLYIARRPDQAFQVLRTLLPGYGGNTIERSGQLPLYIPNAYVGPADAKNAGRSSHQGNTGTAPWYYLTVLSGLLGLRAELDGLRIDPQLPTAWSGAHATRRFRGAEFVVEITRDPAARTLSVNLDGKPMNGNLVPPQKRGSRHTLTVTVPGLAGQEPTPCAS